MSDRCDADVIVVGGGPAGSAAAITCARAGLRVRVLELERFPRDRPGETLHPGVEPIFRQLGVWDRVEARGFPRFKGIRVEWGGPPRFDAFGRDEGGPWQGFRAWRSDLDGLLLEEAREAGVDVVQPCRAIGAQVREGRAGGVNTSEGLVTARFIIDATGGTGWLAREMGLEVQRESRRIVARYGYLEGEIPGLEETPSLVADGDGWTWIARVSPGITAWTRLNMTGSSDPPGWMPEVLRGLRTLKKPRGSDVTWRCVRPAAGPGYFIAGDAAAVLDPASSHGVLKALMSGMMAGHLILRVMNGVLSPADAASAYSGWVNDWFTHDATALKELYRIFPAFGSSESGKPSASPAPRPFAAHSIHRGE